MPITHDINEEKSIVVSTWNGKILNSDIIPSYKKLYEDKRWKAGFNEIADLRLVEMTNVETETLQELSQMVQQYVPENVTFKTAVIANDNLPFGLARVYGAMSAEFSETVMVFKHMKDALKWLETNLSLE